MERILERYERYSFAEKQLHSSESEQNGSWSLEHAKLKARMEVLEKNQKHLRGEEIDSLSIKDLQNLEHQIETALKHVRSRKNNAMFESISELQKKDKALQEQNSLLIKKIKEKEKELAQKAQAEQQKIDLDSNTVITPQPMEALNDGVTYPERCDGIEEVAALEHPNRGNTNIPLPPWMVNNINA